MEDSEGGPVQQLHLSPCPRCHQPVSSERVACRSCGTAHHPECWVHGRGCGFYACGGNPGVLPPPQVAQVASVRPHLRAVRGVALPREPLSASTYAVGVAGALALVFFGLIAIAGRDLHPPPLAGAELLAPALVTAGFFCSPSILHVHGVALDTGAETTLSFETDRRFVPVFRFGRDGVDRELKVRAADGHYAVSLPELEPGATYAFRISGWAGGGAHEGRFVAPPPGGPAPVRQRTHLLDLPDGGVLVPATFGPPRLARPLWARDSVPVETLLAGGRAIIHDGRHVYALDATDGHVCWTHPAPHAAPLVSPVVAAGAVIVATTAGPLALDLDTGRVRWRLPLTDVAGLYVVDDEVYAHRAEQPARLHRVQAADGRLVAILPLPAVPHSVQFGRDQALVSINEPGDARGELLLRGVDRLRGQTRWEKLLFGDELPVLPPVGAGDRVCVALRNRVDLRALGTGEVVASWPLPAPAALVLPLSDGGALVCTGGPVPRAHLLDPQAHVRRAWTLPATVTSGVICADRAVLADPDGVQILELTAGPRWGISGWSATRHLSLDIEGHLLAQVADHVYALGLR